MAKITMHLARTISPTLTPNERNKEARKALGKARRSARSLRVSTREYVDTRFLLPMIPTGRMDHGRLERRVPNESERKQILRALARAAR